MNPVQGPQLIGADDNSGYMEAEELCFPTLHPGFWLHILHNLLPQCSLSLREGNVSGIFRADPTSITCFLHLGQLFSVLGNGYC